MSVDPGYGTRLDVYLRQHPTRALHTALALALGGVEQTLTRNTWRTPSPVTATYLTTLAPWGYPLCPVERIAAFLDAAEPTGHNVEADGIDESSEEQEGSAAQWQQVAAGARPPVGLPPKPGRFALLVKMSRAALSNQAMPLASGALCSAS